MDDDFVHKDTFDEALKRMEAINEASEARNRAEIAAIRGEVSALSEHVSGLENLTLVIAQQLNSKRDRIVAYMGIIAGVSAVILAGVQVLMVLLGKAG